MTTDAKRLLSLIVRLIREGRFIPGRPETYLGYKEAHKLLGLPLQGGTWGRSLKIQGLSDLAHWLQRNRQVPSVTGLIVDTTKRKNHTPGHGYFIAFNKGKEDYTWWAEEMRRAIAFNWSRYSTPEKLPTLKQLEEYESHFNEGKLDKVEARSRKRCEALIRRAKSIFKSKGELRCAACGWSRPRVSLRGDIVEIHHLRPMSSLPVKGVRWTLKEALRHLIPLCPNCHRIAHAKPGGGVFSLNQLKRVAHQ